MKKEFLNLNRGWYIVLSIVCVFVIATGVFVACNHNESAPTPVDDGIEYLIPEDAEVIVSAAGIFKIPESDKILTTEDGDLAILVGSSARPFYLPKDIRHYQKYYDLLTAKRIPNILKLTIGDRTDKGFPIVKVELPDEESEEYLRVKERMSHLMDAEVETRSVTSVDMT